MRHGNPVEGVITQRLLVAATALLVWTSAAVGCGSEPSPGGDTVEDDTVELDAVEGDTRPEADSADAGDASADVDTQMPPDTSPALRPVTVTVTLDEVPVADAIVIQGNHTRQWRTGTDGTVTVDVDFTTPGDIVLHASHPEARTLADWLFSYRETSTIALTRFSSVDNIDYRFQHPGEPGDRGDTSRCGHCHTTFNDQWVASAHRESARNPWLWDVYRGTSRDDAASCADRGGIWLDSPPAGLGAGGNGDNPASCFIGGGVLAETTPGGCPPGTDCSETAESFGGCADCHAPSIDGQLGGRGLHEASGIALDYGVHCDVCHKVESLDLDAPAGVAGRLGILRPSEPSPSLTLGVHKPLTFGPHHDVSNPRMGNVQRDHFRQAALCAGCHEHNQEAFAGGIDLQRWPDGKLPIHSTYTEWLEGPLSSGATCQSCHMPPEPTLANGAELPPGAPDFASTTAGWSRPPGDTKAHTFQGPKTKPSMLRDAAFVTVSPEHVANTLTVTAWTQNVGPGHAIPTGEPMRAMFLVVSATCGSDGPALAATGGDALADIAGHDDMKLAGDDWTRFAGAQVGDLVRVVTRPGPYRDYVGHGRFGSVFSAVEKGVPVEHVAGQSRVSAVATDGTLTFDAPLPPGDVAYLARAAAPGPEALAGRPGIAFAKVLTNATGQRMVPHHEAVDVVSDMRLLPGQGATSTHTFDATGCANPVAKARLVYRRAPRWLALERGWQPADITMVEVSR